MIFGLSLFPNRIDYGNVVPDTTITEHLLIRKDGLIVMHACLSLHIINGNYRSFHLFSAQWILVYSKTHIVSYPLWNVPIFLRQYSFFIISGFIALLHTTVIRCLCDLYLYLFYLWSFKYLISKTMSITSLDFCNQTLLGSQ